jgi:hypothetical protein
MMSWPASRSSARAGRIVLRCARAIAFCLCLMLTAAAAAAKAPSPVALNAHYIGAVRAQHKLDLENLNQVFAFVFRALPDRVDILPTENYFYFSFHSGGIEYAGNMRLDTLDRDKGILHFAYFSKPQPWASETKSKYKKLDAKDGVAIKRHARFVYDVTYKAKTVRFALNDLSKVKPDNTLLRPGEVYLGPVFDESGIEFFLLFNKQIKQFHYILNEQKPVPDRLEPVAKSPGLEIGRRTGFVFYKDRFAERRILIGVNDLNVQLNNFFDGPFDQLPDNFLKGDQLKDALISAFPDYKGVIDRFGNFNGGDGRVLVHPYMLYTNAETDFAKFLICAQKDRHEFAYYTCFDLGEK